MSESENVNKALEKLIEGNEENIKNTGKISRYIESIEGDNESLKWQLKESRKGKRTLAEGIYFSETERKSQEKKAETSLMFMFLFGCLAAVSIAYAILNCQ